MRPIRVIGAVAMFALLLGCWGCSGGGNPPPRLDEPGGGQPGKGEQPGKGDQPPAPGKGYAIAIGLNAIDANHYGTEGLLGGCEADANDMAQIATDLGYPVTRLLTQQATRAAVLAALADHAQRLVGGDYLLVSYSGHGGQVPDQNGDETDDSLDETWCLWDGQLLDDEIYDAWTRFKQGVRILCLSDSCHSGTVMRMMRKDVDGSDPVRTRQFEDKWKTIKRPPRLDRPALLASPPMIKAIERDPKLRAALARNKNLQPRAAGGLENKEPVAVREDDEVFVARGLSPQMLNGTYTNSRQLYDDLGRRVTRERTVAIKAAVLCLSGCEDSQLSADIGFNGLFTWELKRAWANGVFVGGHAAFHEAIKQAVLARNPEQSPAIDAVGLPDQPFRAAKPFTVVR